MAVDVSAASYESGRRALELAVDGGGSVEEIASLLAQEAEEHRHSSSLDPTDDVLDEPVSCDHHTALEIAASAGDMDVVERLLEAGADPDAPVHEMGISALEAAAMQGQLAIVQKLLERGADADHCGRRSDSTPLIAAARAGDIEICEALVQGGANVTIWKRFSIFRGYSAIQAAVDNMTLLELLLRPVEDAARNFDPEALKVAMAECRHEDSRRLLRLHNFTETSRESMNSALAGAAGAGNMPALQRLLDAGAEITNKAYSNLGFGVNTIEAAASEGQLEAMTRLLEVASERNDLPADAVTKALQPAVDAGDIALLEPLLEAGADATEIDIRRAAAAGCLDVVAFMLHSGAPIEVNYRWNHGEMGNSSALQQAAQHGHEAVVDFLLAKGANVKYTMNRPYEMCGVSAVQMAVAGGHLAVTRRLIEAGANVNQSCREADSPLQAAVRGGDTAMLDLLLAAGAVVDVEGFYGGGKHSKTALSVAAETSNPDVVARLLSIMPLDDARKAAPLALRMAAENHNADIARQLLQLQLDINDVVGRITFVQWAAASGSLEILEMLLAEGADANLNPSEGLQQTALQSASERGDLAAVKLLLDAGAETNVTGSTAPPLLLAVRGGHVEIFERLLAAGADIHATAYRGQTMLEAAEESGDADTQDRVRAALDSRPPPQVDQPPDRGTGPLCERCRTAPLNDAFWGSGHMELHPSVAALRASAVGGCPFCCFLWKRLGLTSNFIPQPSPVKIWEDSYARSGMKCYVEEPFPESGGEAQKLSTAFHYWMSSTECRVPITEDTSSPETYKQIRTWLDTCNNEHPKCQAPLGDPSLPTRLIHLDRSGDSPNDASLHPRLVSTDGMEVSECRYIALSYRWPEDFPPEAKSTLHNLSEQMRGLNTSKLPQIFNDVFQVAATMDINYVWIDSLCIVQDDREDWNHEAALMIQIYRHAEFTVAAAVPPATPDLGLFRHPDPSDVLSVSLPGVTNPPSWGEVHDVVVMKTQKETFNESPLISRGWCFQEREISQRIMHYTETQVLWECRTIRASEGYPKGMPERDDFWRSESEALIEDWKGRMLDNDLGEDGIDDAWHRAVEDYSARDLTMFADKLPALAGLAAAVRDYKPAGCRYYAGLWENDFRMGLRWSSRGGGRDGAAVTNERHPRYVAPTWSWASVSGPISYGKRFYREDPSGASDTTPGECGLKVLGVDVQTSTGDPFGAVSHAVLTCTAGLVPGVVRVNRWGKTRWQVENDQGSSLAEMEFDVPREEFEGDGVDVVFCINLTVGEGHGGPGMVVVPTGNKENEFRRVGFVGWMGLPSASEVEIRRITII